MSTALPDEDRTTDRERQMLIVGDGLTGTATAAFLTQAGFDPVVTPATVERPHAGVVPLWEPGLALLERAGLRRPIERAGITIDRLVCAKSGTSWVADTDGRPPLVAVRRSQLRDLCERLLLDRIRTVDRRVTRLDPDGDGVQAAFAAGIEEPFDAAVVTDRSLREPSETTARADSVNAWTFDWPTEGDAPDTATEAWTGDRAAFVMPTTDGARVRLVSAAAVSAAAVSTETLADRFRSLLGPVGEPFAGLDDHEFEYRQVPRAAPASLACDCIAFVGPAARTTVPGGCLAPALAVEDAWVVADALAYGPPDVTDALASYERRRRHRMTDLLRAKDGSRVPTDLAPPLRRLCADRSLAFAHAVEGELPALARGIPESL